MEELSSMNDESLVMRVQSGDHEAFAHLVQRHTNLFFRAAYRMCGQVEEAEDIVQDSFLKFWRKPEAYDASKGVKFTTWFYRVVSNLAIDHMRRKKPQSDAVVLDFMADEAPLADAALEQKVQAEALENAIQALPERQKMALNLCFYEGLSNKEAADILGVGVKALESLLMRAKASLKDQLLREKDHEKIQAGTAAANRGARFYA